MGLLADLYISNDEEAARYDTSPELFAVDRVQFRGFTELELSTLWAIIRGIQWEVSSMDEFSSILRSGGGERLVTRLPPAMVADVARLSPDQMRDVANKWAATEELSCSADDVLPVIKGLGGLA